MNEYETGTDVTDQNIIDAQQVEIDQLEAQLKTVTAERDYSDVCGAQFEQEIRNLKKQLASAISEIDRIQRAHDQLHVEGGKLQAQLDDAKEGWYLANGVADLAMKHRDDAEEQLEAVRPYIQHTPNCPVSTVHYAYAPKCDCGLEAAIGENDGD